MTARGPATIAAATAGHRPPRRATSADIADDRPIAVRTQLKPPPVSDDGAVLVLSPGGTYRLGAWLKLPTPGDRTFTARGEVILHVRWESDQDDDGFVTVDNQGVAIPIHDITHEEIGETFQITVAPDAPHIIGKLTVIAADHRSATKEALYSRRVEIDSNVWPPPAELSREVAIRLNREPDPRLAVLHVYAEHGETFVEGYHPASLLPRTAIQLPGIDLASAEITEDDWYRTIVAHIIDYSQSRLPEVHRWLTRVLPPRDGRVGPDGTLAIIVAEHVDSCIPWEMLGLGDDTVLGERAIVTRWTTIQQYEKTFRLDPVASQQCPLPHGCGQSDTTGSGSGGVLSYLDLEEADQGELPQMLNRCRHDPCKDARGLRSRIEQPIEGVALVMMACHGIFARDDVHQVQLGSLRNPSKRISRLDLVGLAAPRGPRPLVFINACHSARMQRNDRRVFGLPEVFLRSFARGFLGTLTAVEQTVGAEIATRIVSTACSPAGICVPELLFELRRAAAAARRRAPRTFVDTFMYVFYGSPREWLRLETKAPPGGET